MAAHALGGWGGVVGVYLAAAVSGGLCPCGSVLRRCQRTPVGGGGWCWLPLVRGVQVGGALWAAEGNCGSLLVG